MKALHPQQTGKSFDSPESDPTELTEGVPMSGEAPSVSAMTGTASAKDKGEPAGALTWGPAAREHRRARRRCVSPPPRSPRSLTDRIVAVLWPWQTHEYPGQGRLLAAILGTAPETARHIRAGRDALPARHALQLAAFLRLHAAECLALAAEAEEHSAQRGHRSPNIHGRFR
jgi:hypothetical protein